MSGGFLDKAREFALLRDYILRQKVERKSLIEAIREKNEEGYLALIAEYKRASPRGIIRLDLDPWSYFRIVTPYAVGFSVVVEPIYFLGNSLFIRIASQFGKPVLYKDFVVGEGQIEDALLSGASAVLLIKRLMSLDRLLKLIDFCLKKGLEPLVEVDNKEDALEIVEYLPERALLGINARDLLSLDVSIERAVEAIKAVRGRAGVIIAESGVSSRKEAEAYVEAGANAILVGTALMRSPELARELGSIRRK